MTNSPHQEKLLKRNLPLYAILKIFGKRVYLPVIVVFCLTVAHLSIQQIGIITVITTIVQIALQLPTGYFADKFGYKNSFAVGALITMLAPLMYLSPTFLGCLLGQVLFFAGFAFADGSQQSLVHTTLMLLGKEDEYVHFMGIAQTKGLLANVILIAAVPLTYAINPFLPFIIGFFCLVVFAVASFMMWMPMELQFSLHGKEKHSNAAVWRDIFWNRKTLALLLTLFVVALMSSVFDRTNDFKELFVSTVYHLPTAYLGVFTAGGSLIGAGLGYTLGWFNKKIGDWFLYVDALIFLIAGILIGTLSTTIVPIAVLLFLAGYDRNRDTLIHWYIFKRVPQAYKATWISTVSSFDLLNSLWTPLVFTGLLATISIQRTYCYFLIAAALIGLAAYALLSGSNKTANAELANGVNA